MLAPVKQRHAFIIVVALAIGCHGDAPERRPAPAAAIAHAGVGTPARKSDGTRKAVDAALAALASGASPLDAAVAGVVVLEDDARFNAGTGSRVRLDGTTVQMDASVMTSAGRYGAVAIIERVRNPILVAKAVLDTPHNLIAGDGAIRFARTLGLPDYDPATPHRREQTAKIVERLRNRDPKLEKSWRGFDWRRHWNFETPLSELGLDGAKPEPLELLEPLEEGADTVGVAVRGADGTFAVALSTGGTSITLRGRVGDVPILGAGLFAGEGGAVAATGKGERIAEAGSARWVYGRIAADEPPLWAAQLGVAQIAGKGSIGLIVMGRDSMGAAADRSMAWSAREQGSDVWMGPEPRSE